MKRVSRSNISFNVTLPNSYCISFWKKYESGSWEPSTTEIFQDYLGKQSIALDVGAEIGATTMFMASICKRVISVEPSSVGVKIIKDSLNLNKNLKDKISLLQGCLSDSNADQFYGKKSRLFNDIHFINQDGGYKVKSFTIENIARQIGEPIEFIKIDIEGGEYIVLPAMRNFLVTYRPTLLISIHPGFIRGGWNNNFGKIKNIALRYVDNYKLLKSIYGYKYYYDAESKKKISPFSLFRFQYIRGISGNECQILVTNIPWKKQIN